MASNSFSFTRQSLSVLDHAAPVAFVSKTPPKRKSDATQKKLSIYNWWVDSIFNFVIIPPPF